jgi:hypothetical protein
VRISDAQRNRTGAWAAQGREERLHRARRQPIYLLSALAVRDPTTRAVTAGTFIVKGASGTCYSVVVAGRTDPIRCSCPDYRRRQLPCKHVFHCLRVAGVSEEDVDDAEPLLDHADWGAVARVLDLRDSTWDASDAARALDDEARAVALDEALATGVELDEPTTDLLVEGAIMGTVRPGRRPTAVQTTVRPFAPAAADVVARPLDDDEPCGICTEVMSHDAGATAFCRLGCRKSVCVGCLDQLRRYAADAGRPVTCPYCRAKWPAVASR